MVWTEHVPCLLCRAFQNNYHERSHQESAINHLISFLSGTVVEDAVIGIILVSEQPGQFSGVPMHHCQVQRTEIFIEREIRQVIINIEEKSILVILGWFRVRNPIQFV